jgi:hypothetical protein
VETEIRPSVKESDIRDAIIKYLEKQKVFCWPDKQVVGKPHKGTLVGHRGIADILGIYKGKPLAIEVKRPGGELSVEQFRWLTRYKEEGGIAFVATSIEDVQRQLS